MTTTTACHAGRTTAATRVNHRRGPGPWRPTPGEAADTRIGPATAGRNDRPVDSPAADGTAEDRATRPPGLSSRDIESEVLRRLECRGYDWTASPGRRREPGLLWARH